jgi:threonine/homoserine efflux transporter RhtA
VSALAVAFALTAGLLYAGASVLQQRVAAQQRPDLALRPGLLFAVARRPLWQLGLGLDLGAFALEAAALGAGSLILVGPLLVSGLLFALPLSTVGTSRRFTRQNWRAAVALTGGLGLFVVIGSPRGGRTDASGRSWICAGIVLAVIVNVLIVRARQSSSSERALYLGTATGVVHGMTAVLTKTSVDLLGHGFGTVLVHWQPYALAVLSAAAFLLNQSAFHAGHLAASLPAITVVNPVVAALLGWILFGEHLRVHGVAAVAITIVAICASVAAAISLARSPLVAPAVDTHTTT